ncbi:hypothetical protein ANCCAN_00195 [Ancylostoma caninum]|uniref:Uncharacterized protein n=1 Tax=Ancylostoma caninum TaxID=29170 RepID=A0A368HAS1_ANCCA|nr:hypothetical protein ANCCAN_00195 [Ancylostoma caninum]
MEEEQEQPPSVASPGIMLMQLFVLCQHCGAKLSPKRVQLRAIGTAPVTRRQELQRWAKQLHLKFVSDSFFWKWFLLCKPAIEKVYHQHQQKVLDVVRRKYGVGAGTKRHFNGTPKFRTGGLHIAADGAFDSRGYSALIDKVVIVDLETSLILHTKVLHRSETSRPTYVASSIRQQFSDGSRRVAALAAMADKGRVEHILHNNRPEQEAKHKGCIPLSVWYERLKTHLWTAIEVGEGERIRYSFNTRLKHV